MATVDENRESEHLDDHVAPPFLRRVRIRGYKSIAACDVRLQPLTILVGRNGAGKSNFLDALAFLRDVVETSLGEALKRRGGWSRIVNRASPTQSMSFALESGW